MALAVGGGLSQGPGMDHPRLVRAAAALLALFAAAGLASPALAAGPEVGDRAPDFRLVDAEGHEITRASAAGRALVLAWFPKAFTPG